MGKENRPVVHMRKADAAARKHAIRRRALYGGGMAGPNLYSARESTLPQRVAFCVFIVLAALALVAAMAPPRWAQAGDAVEQQATITIEVDGYEGSLPTLVSGTDFTLDQPVGTNPAFMTDESGKQPLAELIEAKEAEGLTLQWHDATGTEFDWFATPVTESITVTGTFAEADYEVRVSFNDEKTDDLTVSVPRGKSFEQAHGSVPATPSKEGWEFVRWVDTSDNSTFDFTKPVTKSTSVYALFKVADTSKVEPFDPTKDIPKTINGRCYIGATWSVHPAKFAVSGFTGGLEGYAGTGTCSLPSAAAPSNVWADYVATLKEVNVEAGEVIYDVNITPPGAAHPGGPRNSLGLIGYQTVYMQAVIKKNFGGYLEVAKTSASPSISENNNSYSLEGAVFGVFDQSGTRVAELVTGADGKTATSPLLPAGTYTIREEKAPRGYAPAPDSTATVTSGATTTASVSDAPQNALVSLIGQKIDAETGKPYPLGSATLKGALFRVSYYDQAGSSTGTPKRTWTFKTDEAGKFAFDKNHFVEGDEFYYDTNHAVTLPLGTVTIEELQAPTGYLKNGKTWTVALAAEGSEEHISPWQPIDITEQVSRGDFSFTKAKSGTMEHLANVPFRITSHTTGEEHVLVTDENGMANTAASWVPHSQNTNAGTSANDGIWFGQDALGNTAPVNDKLGALPYDTYEVEELPCPANENTVLAHFTATISRNNVSLDLGTIDNDTVPLQISGDVDKRETLLDKNGAFDYTIDYRSTSSTWVDEFTMTDTIICAEEGKATLTGIVTPVSFEDYDGLMNVWYRTNLSDEEAESSEGEGSSSEADGQPEATEDAANGEEDSSATEPNASASNPYNPDNPENKRVHNFAGWRVWKENVSTLEPQELSVEGLELAEGEYVTGIAFEHGRVEKGFGTNAPDAESWDRYNRYHETDFTELPEGARATFDLAEAIGPAHTEESAEVIYAPAILHMQATDETLANEETELWNSAAIDTRRNLELHDEDKDAVMQPVSGKIPEEATPEETPGEEDKDEDEGIIEALASKLPKTGDFIGYAPFLSVLALVAALGCATLPKAHRRKSLKEAILENL